MDFVEDILTSEFVFNNPNIKGTCGCGESFNIQCFMIGTAIQLAIAYKSKYKKVGVLPIWIVQSNVSRIGLPCFSDEGPMLETLDYTIRIGSTPTFFISICISTLPTQYTSDTTIFGYSLYWLQRNYSTDYRKYNRVIKWNTELHVQSLQSSLVYSNNFVMIKSHILVVYCIYICIYYVHVQIYILMQNYIYYI